MCLIILKRDEKSVITNRQFKTMIYKNPDGLGFMWKENGRVMTEKCMGTDQQKFDMFRKHRNKQTFVMHSRVRTHGNKDEANCHPFEILNKDKGDPIDLYLMHNGTFSNAPDIDKGMSDTYHYANYILKPLAKANVDLIWTDANIQRMISRDVALNRIVLMRSDDVETAILIFNKQQGEEITGCWHSNNYGAGFTLFGHNDRWSRNNTAQSRRWCSVQQKYIDQVWDTKKREFVDAKEEDDATLILLNAKKNDTIANQDKVVVLRPECIVTEPNTANWYLFEALEDIRTQSDRSIKDLIKNEPSTIADIILELYAKNTMTYEVIMKQLKTEQGAENMVKLLRNMAISEERRYKK